MAYSGIEVVPPHDPEVRQPDLYTAHATGQSEKRGQVHGYYEVTNDATQKRIWGLRRTTFWLSAVLCTVIILAIAIGAGVGVSQRSQGDQRPVSSTVPASTSPTRSPATAEPLLSQTATTAHTAHTTISTPAPTASSTAEVTADCPGSNGTISTYGTRTYQIFCDSDFAGSNKQDLASTVLTTFDNCISLCDSMNNFQSRNDVNAVFNVQGTGDQTPGTCWCVSGSGGKASLNEGNDLALAVQT